MPNEILEINQLDGMVNNIDIEDIADGYIYSGLNIDGDASDGLVVPLASATAISVIGLSGKLSYPAVVYLNNAEYLIGCDVGSGTLKYSNMVSITTCTFSEPVNPKLFTADVDKIQIGNAVYVGSSVDPQILTYFNNKTIALCSGTSTTVSDTTLSGFYMCHMGIGGDNVVGITVTGGTASGNGYFKTRCEYKYAHSFIFDGYQEGLLTESVSLVTRLVTDYNTMVVAFGVNENLNKRITHINIYRSDEAGPGVGYFSNFRLVDSLEVTASAINNLTSVSVASASGYIFKYTDDGKIGPSYKENSGLSEGYTIAYVPHKLGLYIESYYVIGDVVYKDTSKSTLMRSIRYNPSVFDLLDTSNILVLEEDIHQLLNYKNRIIALGTNNSYMINPLSFTLEEKLNGLGVNNKHAAIVFNDVLYIANSKGVFAISQQGIQDITLPIRQSNMNISSYSYWSSVSHLGTNITYLGAINAGYNYSITLSFWKNYLIITMYTSGSAYIVFAYHTIKKKWYKWRLPSDALKFVSDFVPKTFKNGKLMLLADSGSGNYEYKYWGDSTTDNLTAEFLTKAYNMQAPTQKKYLFDLQTISKLNTSGYCTTYYSVNTTNTEGATDYTTFVSTISKQYFKRMVLYVKLSNSILKSISVIYRRLIGAR